MIDSVQFSRVLKEWVSVFMRRSMQEFRDSCRQAGISMTHLSALMRLHHCGSCGVSDIAMHLGVTNAAASQMVERLVQAGLLEREEDPQDRRSKLLRLTPEGEQLVHENITSRLRWLEGLTSELSPEQQEQIVSALTLLTETARAQEGPAESPCTRFSA